MISSNSKAVRSGDAVDCRSILPPGSADCLLFLRLSFGHVAAAGPARFIGGSKAAQTSCSSKSAAFSEDEPQSFSKSRLCATSLGHEQQGLDVRGWGLEASRPLQGLT